MAVVPAGQRELPEGFVEAPDDEQARDLLARLHAQTLPGIVQASRPPAYNAPDRWYAKPDGDIVLLQGDAASQAYFVAKGFHLLTPAETREWLEVVRPLVVKEQNKRARLITTLRRIAAKHPGVELVGDLEITPTDELEDMLAQLKAITGGNVAVVMGRFREDQDREVVFAALPDVRMEDATDLARKVEESAARAAMEARGGRQNGKFQGAGSGV